MVDVPEGSRGPTMFDSSSPTRRRNERPHDALAELRLAHQHVAHARADGMTITSTGFVAWTSTSDGRPASCRQLAHELPQARGSRSGWVAAKQVVLRDRGPRRSSITIIPGLTSPVR